MTLKMRRLIIPLAFAFVGFLPSCGYDFVVPEKPPVINPEEPIGFASQIEPIFAKNNQCTACHKTGATAPNLSTGNAFASIVPSLVNTTNPESSKIYQYPHPSTATHSWKKYELGDAALILEWIKQGAKNN